MAVEHAAQGPRPASPRPEPSHKDAVTTSPPAVKATTPQNPRARGPRKGPAMVRYRFACGLRFAMAIPSSSKFLNFNVRCWAFDVRCSMFDVRCSMFDVRCSMFDVRCSMFDVRCSMFDVRCSAPSSNPVFRKLIPPRSRDQQSFFRTGHAPSWPNFRVRLSFVAVAESDPGRIAGF
jgi:hypothetical protein